MHNLFGGFPRFFDFLFAHLRDFFSLFLPHPFIFFFFSSLFFFARPQTKSKGLVKFYEVFYKSGNVYLCLEYCDCGSLANVREKVGIIPEEVLGKMACDILEGFICLHGDKKHAHRDIKPSNICLNSKGETKLADFGISRKLQNSLSRCRTHVGTVSYMSPERILGKEYGRKGDIWGLGILLLECATGKYPYPQENVLLHLVQNIAEGDSPKLPENSQFSKEFRDFISRCLLKDPGERPSAKELKKHPWIVKSRKSKFNMVKWIKKSGLILKLPDLSNAFQRLSIQPTPEASDR